DRLCAHHSDGRLHGQDDRAGCRLGPASPCKPAVFLFDAAQFGTGRMTDDKTRPEESPLDPGESIAGGEAIVEGAPGAAAPGAGAAAANAEAGAPDAAATDAGGVAGPDDEPIDPLAVLR